MRVHIRCLAYQRVCAVWPMMTRTQAQTEPITGSVRLPSGVDQQCVSAVTRAYSRPQLHCCTRTDSPMGGTSTGNLRRVNAIGSTNDGTTYEQCFASHARPALVTSHVILRSNYYKKTMPRSL